MSILTQLRFPKEAFVYHNFPIASSFYIKNKHFQIEKHMSHYNTQIQALLMKRQITKAEIIPKVKILPTVLSNFTKEKKEKSLFSIDEQVLQYIYNSSKLTKNYWLNIFLTKYDLEFYSTCKDKITLKGQMPSMSEYDTYYKIKNKVLYLTDVYDKGLPMTDYERYVYSEYILEKGKLQSKLKEGKIIMKEIIDFDKWLTPDKIYVLKKYGATNEALYNTQYINDKYNNDSKYNSSIDNNSPFRYDINKYIESLDNYNSLINESYLSIISNHS